MKKILHIDLNAFFAQAEVLKDPSLKGKPIAIGSDQRRGVLSTASYEARKYGVNSAMPVSIAKEKCPDLILVCSNYSYYSRLSNQFFSYLRSKFSILEQASIDECYIDARDYLKDERIEEQLFDLQMDIFKHTKLKCSIGYSYNKFLAKMASDMKKPLGITIITQENLKEILWPLDISSMYGIGKKTYPKLIENGIKTIGDLANTNNLEVKKILGSSFEYFKEEANGIASDFVDPSDFDPKSISSERTFIDDILDFDDLRSMIDVLSNDVFKELKSYNKYSDTVVLKLRNSDFITKNKQKKLNHFIKSKEELSMVATNILEEIYKGEPIRLIGVGLEKVVDKDDIRNKKDNFKIGLFDEVE